VECPKTSHPPPPSTTYRRGGQRPNTIESKTGQWGDSLPTLEVVGFGAFCGANHSTFHFKNTPHLYVTNGVRLTFLLKNSYKFHFLIKDYEKIKPFSTLIFLHPKNIPNWYSKYSLVKLLKWPVLGHSTLSVIFPQMVVFKSNLAPAGVREHEQVFTMTNNEWASWLAANDDLYQGTK
jgi:hypothetical protein